MDDTTGVLALPSLKMRIFSGRKDKIYDNDVTLEHLALARVRRSNFNENASI